MYKIGESINISVTRTNDANFDRACDSAYKIACTILGLDEDGHCKNVKDWNCSTDIIIIDFNHYRHIGSMTGQTRNYTFMARAERNNEII